MDPLTIGLVASAAIGAGTSLYNSWNQKRTNKQIMDREDNSVYRRTQDLIKSGLSPVLAAGSGATTSQLNAPQLDSSSVEKLPLDLLALRSGNAQISHTKAQTALTNQQVTSEEFKQSLMQGQMNEIDERIKNMASERQGIDMRNSWINADMSSTLKLRDGQLEHLAKDTLRIGQQTELLKAQTSYEQTAMDKLLTDIDNAKILRDMNMIDRDYRANIHKSTIWNNFSSGNYLKTLLGGIAGGSAIMEQIFPKLSFDKERDKWYYPSK